MAASISEIRNNYSKKKLLETKASGDPMLQFAKWWKQAIRAKVYEANAMTLATASNDGIPSARIVLLKGISATGLSFYTNYDSYKGQQLAENPKACLVFFWKELERQVRITGLVEKLPEIENDQYFHSRPKLSQIGAVISPQSQVIESRDWLDEQFGIHRKIAKEGHIKRPANWGGYLVKPVIIEFWQGRPGRLHDRLQYTIDKSGTWKMERLAP